MEALGWDEELPKHFKMEWKRWFEELAELGAVRVSRCLKEDQELRDVTIHTFSDASEKVQHRTFAMTMRLERLAHG